MSSPATLADILGTPVRTDRHFFDDLGADSMVMARFCARVRKRDDVPAPSMRQVTPTRRSHGLAAALARRAGHPRAETRQSRPAPPLARAGTLGYLACGTAQLLTLVAYLYLVAVALLGGYSWIAGADGTAGIYGRAVVVGAAGLLGAAALPVLAKWLLVVAGRPTEIRIWSAAYCRFWLVKTLLRTSPALLVVGSPLYVLYLRALGAQIGPRRRGPHPAPPGVHRPADGRGRRGHPQGLVPELLPRRGRRHSYRPGGGRPRRRRGRGDGARHRHRRRRRRPARALVGAAGGSAAAAPAVGGASRVPAGTCARCVPRRVGYSAYQLVVLVFLGAPLALGLVAAVVAAPGVPRHPPGARRRAPGRRLVIGLLVATTVPRLLARAVPPDRDLPLYGVRYAAHRIISRLTNAPVFVHLLGDSSYVVPYLRAVGYDLSDVSRPAPTSAWRSSTRPVPRHHRPRHDGR